MTRKAGSLDFFEAPLSDKKEILFQEKEERIITEMGQRTCKKCGIVLNWKNKEEFCLRHQPRIIPTEFLTKTPKRRDAQINQKQLPLFEKKESPCQIVSAINKSRVMKLVVSTFKTQNGMVRGCSKNNKDVQARSVGAFILSEKLGMKASDIGHFFRFKTSCNMKMIVARGKKLVLENEDLHKAAERFDHNF
jgi:predicted transcriptional regulator